MPSDDPLAVKLRSEIPDSGTDLFYFNNDWGMKVNLFQLENIDILEKKDIDSYWEINIPIIIKNVSDGSEKAYNKYLIEEEKKKLQVSINWMEVFITSFANVFVTTLVTKLVGAAIIKGLKEAMDESQLNKLKEGLPKEAPEVLLKIVTDPVGKTAANYVDSKVKKLFNGQITSFKKETIYNILDGLTTEVSDVIRDQLLEIKGNFSHPKNNPRYDGVDMYIAFKTFNWQIKTKDYYFDIFSDFIKRLRNQVLQIDYWSEYSSAFASSYLKFHELYFLGIYKKRLCLFSTTTHFAKRTFLGTNREEKQRLIAGLIKNNSYYDLVLEEIIDDDLKELAIEYHKMRYGDTKDNVHLFIEFLDYKNELTPNSLATHKMFDYRLLNFFNDEN